MDVTSSPDIYAQKALSQIPRILGNQDRNPFSPTYGCFHRDFWLDKTSDFPDAVRQFAVHALALVYKNDIPGNIYYQQPKIKDWALAGLEYWAKIQHSDGSFDEFYPYERGWVGPTAFTTYTSIESLKLLREETPDATYQQVLNAIRKAAYLISAGESEEDHLANHHAMACLAVWKSYELLGDERLKDGFERLWRGFLNYHTEEGWSIEYDGIDPGYLSATVSFLSKIYQSNPDPRIFEIIKQSVEMCSFFVYPNGYYAGSMGSRNTLHFYSHGFEVVANEIPLAGSISEFLQNALAEDKLVPPEIISDRYLVYRVPEFLLTYLDYRSKSKDLPQLPFERDPFCTYFSGCRVYVKNEKKYYSIANLSKGGVLKVFNKDEDNKLVFNDCGWVGRVSDGRTFTNQWIDPNFTVSSDDQKFEIEGVCHWVPSHKTFNLVKNLIFRTTLLLTGWSPKLSHILKGRIRKALMIGQRPTPISFHRSAIYTENTIRVNDKITLNEPVDVDSLSLGDEFFIRYVPQSRYFQRQELDVAGVPFGADQIAELNNNKKLEITREIVFD